MRAQTAPRPDSTRVVVLSDVAVSDKLTRLVVATGKRQLTWFHNIAPGSGYAIRFRAPRGSYHQLSQLLVHLNNPGGIKEGGLRVRAASITPEGQPASDDLLPAPVLLTTAVLQRARRHLTLVWPPGARLAVPEAGFFLVLEGVGRQPDEYVSRYVPSPNPKRVGQLEIRRRDHPEVTAYLTTPDAFPSLSGAKPATTEFEIWRYDGTNKLWRLSQYRESVVFLEAVFE